MSDVRTYHRPVSVEEALKLVVQKGRSGAILAGGSGLVPRLDDDVTDIIDLQAAGLDRIEVSENQITFGAMTRLQSVVKHQAVPDVVKEAAKLEGPNTMRNAATIGGVVVGGDWESELCAAMLVYDAQITIQTPGDLCEVPLKEFVADEFPDGIVTQVSIARDGFATRQRTARTPADKPIVAVYGRRGADGAFRLAFCGVADRPVLLAIDELASISPPGDFRGSPDYRQAVAIVLARRVLRDLS